MPILSLASCHFSSTALSYFTCLLKSVTLIPVIMCWFKLNSQRTQLFAIFFPAFRECVSLSFIRCHVKFISLKTKIESKSHRVYLFCVRTLYFLWLCFFLLCSLSLFVDARHKSYDIVVVINFHDKSLCSVNIFWTLIEPKHFEYVKK